MSRKDYRVLVPAADLAPPSNPAARPSTAPGGQNLADRQANFALYGDVLMASATYVVRSRPVGWAAKAGVLGAPLLKGTWLMRLKFATFVVAAAAAMVMAVPLTSGAATDSVYVLDLSLNEPAAATTAVDASGMGHDGDIGSHVVMNGAYADWDRHPPGEGVPYGLEHLITVPDADDGSLDPGAGDFTVEFRFKTKENFGNIMQKGQARTVGGQVKFQIPKGKLSCMFRTPEGIATATSGATLLNDDLWHDVRCVRTSTSVTLYADGVQVGRKNGFTGNLDNKKPWTIGGKHECDAVIVTCDYFAGEIDYVKMTKAGSDGGGEPADTTAPVVTSTTPAADAVGAPRDSDVTATFSEVVTDVSAATVILRKTSTDSRFKGVVTYDPATHTATLNPDVTLPRSTEFNVTLTNGIRDVAGNALAPTTWSFTTGS